MYLVVLAENGLWRLEPDGARWRAARLWEGPDGRASAIDPRDPDVLFLATRGDGVLRSSDGGDSWSRLYVREGGGSSWTEREALRRLPSAPTWSFPPRPWTSHVSAIAPHPRDADLLLVGIELGGLMRSKDGGRSWQDHRPEAQRDVHAIAWHPSGDGRAFEAGGAGAARSDDHGASWEPADAGRDRSYCWALGVAPGAPETWLVSAAPGPRHAHGDRAADAGLYRRRGAEPWQRVEDGLPRPLDDMPYALAVAEGVAVVGLRSGRLFLSDDLGTRWREAAVVGGELAVPRSVTIVERA